MPLPQIPRENNLDLLRFIAASMVFLSHGITLHGGGYPFGPFLGHTYTLASLAVAMFFVISGFLVTASWCRQPHILTYLQHRALRIFPALVISVLLTIAVLGPLITSLPLREYLEHPDAIRYLRNIVLYPGNKTLPGVFENNHTIIVNGSLWTLAVEFCMYILVILLGITGLLQRRYVPLIILAFFVCYANFIPVTLTIAKNAIPVYFSMKHALAFLGACCYIFTLTMCTGHLIGLS